MIENATNSTNEDTDVPNTNDEEAEPERTSQANRPSRNNRTYRKDITIPKFLVKELFAQRLR